MSRRKAPTGPDGHIELCLYIAGAAPHSVRAMTNLRAICTRHLDGGYKLEIIDVLVEPQRAIADGVIATPTLVKRGPGERQRIIGDLTDELAVLATLGVQARA